MFDLVTIDIDCDIVDVNNLVPTFLRRSWLMTPWTYYIDFYIVHVFEFVFARTILPPVRMVVVIRLNTPFVTHSLHLQYPFLLTFLSLSYAMGHGSELAFTSQNGWQKIGS